MQDVLVAATPPIVTALLAAVGVWLRRRSQARTGQRALEEARTRIGVITSMIDAYQKDPSRAHGSEVQQLLNELDEAYRQMTAAEETARHEAGAAGAALASTLLLLDRKASTATAKVAQVLYYLSLAWVVLWLAAALLFGFAIAFAEGDDPFGVRLAMSFGITALSLAIGLAPALVLHLIARMSSSPANRAVGSA